MQANDHPSDAELTAFLRGVLEPATALSVESHLGACDHCCTRLDSLPAGRLEQIVRRAADDTTAVRASSVTSSPSAAPPGYDILGELGRGGMGVVYRARQVSLGRVVALKMVLGGAYADAESRERFRSEAAVLARMRHPNIVQVHEAGVHDGQPFLVMEYVEGGSLAVALRTQYSVLSATVAAQLIETLALAVQHAHENGVVHRDLKPANVLLQNSVPKIADFGLARSVEGSTSHTAVAGTPAYMAPEQVSGDARSQGPATDVYALGAVLYELLTGRPPFLADAPLGTMQQVAHNDPVPLRRLLPGVSRDLETVCLKCLEKEPGRRYATARALADDLRAFLHGRPVRARPVGAVGRTVRWARRQPLLASLWAAVVVAVGVGMGLFLWQFQAAVHQSGVAESRRLSAEAAERRAVSAQYAAQMTLLHRNLGDGLFGEAEQILDACPTTPRGWEYRHFLALTRAQMHTVAAHPAVVYDVAVSPDGSLFASAGGDGTVRLWDASTGTERRLLYQGDPVEALEARSKAGQPVLLFGSTARGLLRWDVETGRELSAFRFDGRQAPRIAVSRDGGRVALTTEDHAIRVLNAETGEEECVFRGHQGRVTALAFAQPASGGTLLASSSEDGTVRCWDLKTRTIRFTERGQQEPVRAVAAQPADAGLASVSDNRRIRLLDPDTRTTTGVGGTVGVLAEQPSLITCLAFSPDGRSLATAGPDGVVRLLHLPTRSTVQQFQGHREGCTRVRFTPDGRRLISAGVDGTVRMWRTGLRHGYRSWLAGLAGNWSAVAFLGDGSELLTLCSTGQLTCRDLTTGQPSNAPTPSAPLRAAACSRSGRALCVAADGRVLLWDARTGQPLALKGGTEAATCVACTPDGDLFAAGRVDGTLTIWDARGAETHTLAVGRAQLTGVALAGDTVAAVDVQGAVTVWTQKGASKGRFAVGPVPIGALAFRPGDPNTLAVAGGADGKVHICDFMSGERSVLGGHAGAVADLAFSADGTRLLTAGLDRTLRLWDAANGQQLVVLATTGPHVNRVVWSRDGGSVAATFGDGTVRVWSDRIDP